jgi:hypothetical protein
MPTTSGMRRCSRSGTWWSARLDDGTIQSAVVDDRRECRVVTSSGTHKIQAVRGWIDDYANDWITVG